MLSGPVLFLSPLLPFLEIPVPEICHLFLGAPLPVSEKALGSGALVDFEMERALEAKHPI